MEYVWYWLDDSNQWIEYGKEHPDHVSATVTSAFLENEYLADKNGVIFFRAGSQQYKLDFADMVQTNVLFQTQRRVIRLPKQSEGGQDGSQNTTLSHPVYPPHWDQTALPDIGFKLIQLSYDSQEYGKIKRLFEKTMKNYCINQLQRIQNPTLWDIFQWSGWWPRLMTAPKPGSQASYPPHWLCSLTLAGDHMLAQALTCCSCWGCGHLTHETQGPTPVAASRPPYMCMYTDWASITKVRVRKGV
ncbi:protein mono-ADP-ribosyltransferase PARP12-like isoform X4 [Corvus kubaryi]|uniref:protein mono-ADP-ribosyltransferase PARP12-like isoform X4 n=1 Tax=Corvus kubaryi TaxID=68294 RepID=UPI001C04BC40|nr:protein mono-ADP-ribosyltransferase PARP12-like isoform X4 [Corvus kubaryi]XP_041901502.1 protein mono-ADP-ribosyltransferase PARP12-like isoform X4 [Corvus kubaryi]